MNKLQKTKKRLVVVVLLVGDTGGYSRGRSETRGDRIRRHGG